MSYKKVIALARMFSIKLAGNEPTVPGIVDPIQGQDPNKTSENLAPTLPPMSPAQEPVSVHEMMTDPGQQPAPQDREFAEKLDKHLRIIRLELQSDYSALKSAAITEDSQGIERSYFYSRPKEIMAMREIIAKFEEIFPKAYSNPFRCMASLNILLESAPSIKLHNPVTNTQSNTIKDNIHKIYYEATAELMNVRRRYSRGLLKAPKLRGLKMLLDFDLWEKENLTFD